MSDTTNGSEADAARALGIPPELVAQKAKEWAQGDGFQAQIFKAIAVQRPVVLEYLRSVRRDKPDASPADILKELDSRYVATVTIASSGVGASAAIPGIGIPVALGLGVADLLFFYETSALYVLAVAELHGISVTDPERARPLVLGMLLGQKSQSEVNKWVMSSVGGAGIGNARSLASGAVAKSLPQGWGDVLTQQLPDSALAPLTIVIGREALKIGGKAGASTLGKAIPFGVGAVIGGLGSYTFGRDVVKASRLAFPAVPDEFPEWLHDYVKPERVAEPSRASLALEAAAGSAKDFGESVWGKVSAATEAFRSVDLDGDGIPDEARALTAVKRAGGVFASTAGKAADKFRSVDVDGDGVADEPEALTAVKDAGAAAAAAADAVRGKVTSFLRSKQKHASDGSESAQQHPED